MITHIGAGAATGCGLWTEVIRSDHLPPHWSTTHLRSALVDCSCCQLSETGSTQVQLLRVELQNPLAAQFKAQVMLKCLCEYPPPMPQETLSCVLKGGPELCLSDLSLNPAMLACYPGDGARFESHLDNNPAAPDCRLVTVEGLRDPLRAECWYTGNSLS